MDTFFNFYTIENVNAGGLVKKRQNLVNVVFFLFDVAEYVLRKLNLQKSIKNLMKHSTTQHCVRKC